MSLSFIPLSPAPGYRQLPFRGPVSCPKKQEGTRRRTGRGCGFSHELSRQLSPSPLTPQTSGAPHSGRLPPQQKAPAARPPRAPAAPSASGAAEPKSALPAFAQVHREAPWAPGRPPNLGPDSPAPDGAYLLTRPGRSPGVPRGKAVPPRPRRSPNSPRNWFQWPAEEGRRGRAGGGERGGRRVPPRSGRQSARRGARSRRKGEPPKARGCPARWGEQGRSQPAGEDGSSGRGRTARGHWCLRLPEDQGRESWQQSEPERSNLPLPAPAREEKLGRTFKGQRARVAGNASSRERREEGAVRVGGDGAGAGGRDSPTPGPARWRWGPGRRRERGARGRGGRNAAGRARAGGRARAAGRGGGARGARKRSPSSGAAARGPRGRHGAGIRGMPGCPSSFRRLRRSRALLTWQVWGGNVCKGGG